MAVIKPWTWMYTKKQLLRLFADARTTEPPPKKRQTVYINFPPTCVRRLATVTWYTYKSTYGKRLYLYVLTEK